MGNLSERTSQKRSILPELRKKQVWGLILLAAIVLAFTIGRAGLDRVFPPGWWRIW